MTTTNGNGNLVDWFKQKILGQVPQGYALPLGYRAPPIPVPVRVPLPLPAQPNSPIPNNPGSLVSSSSHTHSLDKAGLISGK